MAKRPLGLSKSNQAKRARREETPPPQVTLELAAGEDAASPLVQLRALWRAYWTSARDTDVLLNGVLNELTTPPAQMSAEQRAICALALSELAVFKAGVPAEDAVPGEDVHACFERALQVLDAGESEDADPLESLARSKVLFQRVPLEHVSQLSVQSDEGRLQLALDAQLEGGKAAFRVDTRDLPLSLEVLRSFDDLLDIAENFGDPRAADEGLDSEDEDEESDDEEETETPELAENHPLYPVQQRLGEHYDWLAARLADLAETAAAAANAAAEPQTLREIARARGELALRRAQPAVQAFLRQTYGENESKEEDEARPRKTAAEQLEAALELLRAAQDPEDPDTWVAVAEGLIERGNVLRQGSAEQDKAYADAEALLERANVAAHGKYADVLENFREK